MLVLAGLRSLDAPTIEWGDTEGLDGSEPTLFPECPLVFPTAGHDGRVTHMKNSDEDALRGFGYTPHIARHTFASPCEEARLSVLATKLLLNHRDRTITEGYQELSMDHLRGELERVTAFLLGLAGRPRRRSPRARPRSLECSGRGR